MKKIIALFAVAFATATMAGSWFSPGFNWNNTNQDLDLIVNGSLTGGANSVAQLIAKDSQSGKFPGIKLTAVAPGNACKGFALIKQRPNDTFVTYYENYYQLVAKQKNDASCPSISFEDATPVVSYVQSLYLVTKKSTTLADFSNKKLKVGYSGSGPENIWHDQINAKFGQDHVFVGYSGSGNMRSGIASGEVDAVWTTYRHFLKLKKQKDVYSIAMRTLDTLDVDAPVLAHHFNDATLSRAFLSAWYVFNDRDGIAEKIAHGLKTDVENKTGEFGTYANTKKLILTFDQPTQKAMEKSLSWDQ
jgi:tripartite-type tricarboxylate transporter receptor subunit TctC